MRRTLVQLVDRAKRSRRIDIGIRYNPFYYRPVRQLIRGLEDLDPSGRRALSKRLLDRTLGWAREALPEKSAAESLMDWPILEKEDLRGNEEKYRRASIIAIPAATGGTTGIPIRLWRSMRSIAAEQAFLDGAIEPSGFSFRSARIVVLRGDNIKPPSDRSPPYGRTMGGGKRLILSSQHLSTQTAQWYADEINQFCPDILFVYPSSGEVLARNIIEQDLKVHIPLVLSASEMLHLPGRRMLGRAFHARVIDYYGLAERNVFAVSEEEDRYFFNPAYGFVELLPVEEAPPHDGLKYAEIVGTGFWNACMPLVRLRTGDRILYSESYDEEDLHLVALGLKPFVAVAGRDKDYLISPRGEILVGIDHIPREISNIVRLQVVQESPHLVRVMVIADPAFSEIDLDALHENVRRKVPRDMEVTVQLTDELETLASGKVPYVIRRF